MKKQILNEKFSRMQKLAGLLKEGYAWERKEGKPLPTIKEVMDEYEASQKEEVPVQEMASKKSMAVSALKSEVQSLKGNRKELAKLAMSIIGVLEDIESMLGSQDNGDLAEVYNDFYATIVDDEDEEEDEF